MEAPFIERRGFPRRDVCIAARYRLGLAGPTGESWVRDLSGSGLRLRFAASPGALPSLAPGIRFELTFSLPEEPVPISAQAEIIYVSNGFDYGQEAPCEVGARFVTISPIDRYRILTFVERPRYRL